MIKLFLKFLNKFFIKFILFFYLGSCAFSPGMSPKITKDNNEYINNIKLNHYTLETIDFSLLPNQKDYSKKNSKMLEEITNDNFYRYLLGIGDLVNIKVTDVDEIQGDFIIGEDGSVNLPYVGKVIIVDLTKNEAQLALESSIGEYYQSPEVILEIKEFKSRYIYITGEISKPQSILLTDKKINLVDAILLSGYIKDQKSFDKNALLKRNNSIYPIDLHSLLNELDTNLNIYLREDDIIHIEKKTEDMIYVFGEASQGSYSVFQNNNLTKLLSNIKLNQVTADMSKVYVIREDKKSYDTGNIYELDLKNPNALFYSNQFNLITGDVVFISPSPIVRWNRVISLITPQSGIFTTYRDITDVIDSEFAVGIDSGAN